MRALLLHNPKAGDNRFSGAEIVRALEAAGYFVRYAAKDDAAGFAAGLAERPDIVAVAGGDGSIGQLLDYYAALTMPVALLPLGTSNNIARSFGIPVDLRAVIAGLRDAPTRALDIGIANGPWGYRLFVEAIGFGLLAPLMSRRVRAETTEKARALAREMVISSLARAKAAPLWLSVDGEVVEEPVIMAEVTSISRVGPALHLLDDDRTGDHQLDVIILRPSDRVAMIEWLRDGSPGAPPIVARQGRAFAAVWDKLPLRIDDKKMRRSDRQPSHVFARHTGAVIRVLVPEGQR